MAWLPNRDDAQTSNPQLLTISHGIGDGNAFNAARRGHHILLEFEVNSFHRYVLAGRKHFHDQAGTSAQRYRAKISRRKAATVAAVVGWRADQVLRPGLVAYLHFSIADCGTTH